MLTLRSWSLYSALLRMLNYLEAAVEDGKGKKESLDVTSGSTIFVHSKGVTLSPRCADGQNVHREIWGAAPYGVETTYVVHREAGKCSLSAGNHLGSASTV